MILLAMVKIHWLKIIFRLKPKLRKEIKRKFGSRILTLINLLFLESKLISLVVNRSLKLRYHLLVKKSFSFLSSLCYVVNILGLSRFIKSKVHNIFGIPFQSSQIILNPIKLSIFRHKLEIKLFKNWSYHTRQKKTIYSK